MWLILSNEFEIVKHDAEKLFSGDITASDAGILFISSITIKLDEIEKGFKSEAEDSINEYLGLEKEDKEINGVIQLHKDSAKNKLKKLNEVRDFKKKWNTYWVEVLAYV